MKENLIQLLAKLSKCIIQLFKVWLEISKKYPNMLHIINPPPPCHPIKAHHRSSTIFWGRNYTPQLCLECFTRLRVEVIYCCTKTIHFKKQITKKCMTFVKQHLNLTEQFWKVVCSDESKFRIFDCDGQKPWGTNKCEAWKWRSASGCHLQALVILCS